MFISHKLKLIFAHIPKTGGSCVKVAIRKLDKKSFTYRKCHSGFDRKVICNYPNYCKVTCVRNSYKIVVSKYRFDTQFRGKKFPPFKEWIKHSRSIVFKQLTRIKDDKGPLVDKILHLETLDDDIKELNKTLGINLKLGAKSHYYGKYNYKDYYDEESKQIVYNRCKKDIEYFNWKFEE